MNIKYIIIIVTLFAAVSAPMVNGAEMENSAAVAKSSKSGATGELKKARTAADSLSSTQKSKLLILLNEGSNKELLAIKGIAASRSQEIIKARPFQAIEDLVTVKGIGLTTFSKVLDHSKGLRKPKS